jgi:hypothetical protein
MCITDSVEVKSDARPDQLITFTRCPHEALPIKDRDLPPAARNQAGMFQLPGSIRDGWPLDTQHFGEQVLSDPRASSSPRSRIISSQRASVA